MGGNYCFVPGCSSGNKADRERRKKEGERAYSMFRTPRNAEDLSKWNKIIGRADRDLTERDRVCELHFEEEDILRFFETKMPEGYIHRIEKVHPTLRPGALPVIYSNPSRKASRRKRTLAPPKITMVLKTKTDFSEVITIEDTVLPPVNYTVTPSRNNATQSDNSSRNCNAKSNVALQHSDVSSDDESNDIDYSLPPTPDTLCRVIKAESKTPSETFDGEDTASPEDSNISSDADESDALATLKYFWSNAPSRENERNAAHRQTHRGFNFQFLSENLDQVKRPSELWTLNSMPDYIICAKWDRTSFTAERRLVVDSNLCVKVYLKHVEILGKLNVDVKVSSFQDLSSLLLDVRDFILCAGIDNISPNKDCLMYIGTDESSRLCLSCRRAKKNMRKRKTVTQWKESMSKINEKWRSRAICNERKQLRLQQKVDKLHKDVISLRMKWASANRQIERQKKIISNMEIEP